MDKTEHLSEVIEMFKSWVWEHCEDTVDYILALHYARLTDEEILAELIDDLGLSRERAESDLEDARKWF